MTYHIINLDINKSCNEKANKKNSIDLYESYSISKNNIDNSIDYWVNFWSQKIGINIIYGDTKNKRPHVFWKKYQIYQVPFQEIENWKKERKFEKGILGIPGRVCGGNKQGQYLVPIDIDKEQGIRELLKFFGNNITIEDLSKKPWWFNTKMKKIKHIFIFILQYRLHEKLQTMH